MMRNTIGFGTVVLALAAGSAQAQVFEMNWSTVDGGGTMNATGGAFTLSGTTGQPDAGEMAGGAFVLSGGFWPGVGSGGGKGGCNGGETISKAKCKTKRGNVSSVTVLVKNATPGQAYEAVLDTGQALVKKAKNTGSAKFTFKGNNAPPCGDNGATVCDVRKPFSCGC